MSKIKTGSLAVLSIALIFGCKEEKKSTSLDPISPETIKQHIAVLADDSLEGRRPFTVGETKTVNYISAELKKAGVQPANNGSYIQKVPMV